MKLPRLSILLLSVIFLTFSLISCDLNVTVKLPDATPDPDPAILPMTVAVC